MVVGDVGIGTDVLVIGAGPAGYATAMACAGNGLDVTLAYEEMADEPLLYAGYLLDSLKRYGRYNPGHAFDVTLAKRRKDAERKLARCKQAGVQALKGRCSFLSSSRAVVSDVNGRQDVDFRRAVIATGICYKDDSLYRILLSKKLPEKAAIKGSGEDAVALASILAASGCDVSLDNGGRLLPGMDGDLVERITGKFKKSGAEGSTIDLSGTVAGIDGLGLENTGVKADNGFIEVDGLYGTTDPAVYAVGGVTGLMNPGLAYRDGKSLASLLAGRGEWIRPQYVPVIIYSDPPSGSVGVSAAGVSAIAPARDGFVKVVAEQETGRITGVHCICEDAHGLLAEATLALEMGARLDDAMLTVHPYNESYNAFLDACAMAASSRKGPSR